MRCLLIMLATLVLPCVGLAEPLRVRSGEHADFSRLVINYGDDSGWTFAKVDGGYEVRPTTAGMTYDLKQVFKFIPRDRIAAIEIRAGGILFLEVNCQCHAESFEHLGQAVVDVKDGAPKGEIGPTPHAEALRNLDAASRNPIPPLASLSGAESNRTGLAQLSRSRERSLEWADSVLSSPLAPGLPIRRTTNDAESLVPDPRLAETQASLVAQIARAASEGLITPDLTQPHSLDAKAKGNDASSVIELPDVVPEAPLRIAGPNIRIETAYERGELSNSAPTLQNENGNPCLAPAKFDLATWGQPPEQGAAIAKYRAGLVGEFDAADPASLMALAKHYIYLTFGAEARTLIHSFEGQIKGADLFVMMAEIMDDGQSNAFPEIAAQISCDSASALWAILANPVLTRSKDISRPAVLSAFVALPLHLRRHIGPTLVDRFLQIEDAESAATIRNSIIRAPGANSADVRMMQAEIALELGDRQAGLSQLDQILDESGSKTPEAVISLIRTSLKAGNPPAKMLIETAQALAFESRGTPMGADLTIASLRATAHSDNIVEALDQFEQSIEPFGLKARDVDEFRREVIDLASQSESDAQFLRIVLRGTLNLGTGEAATDLRRRVAARLIGLGLPQSARDVLGEDPGVPAPKDRMLYAQSFLGEDRPELAIGYLAGLSDKEAVRLRANAHAMAQEFDRAGVLYSDLGQIEDSARVAWRGQNLARVREIGRETERAAAALDASENPVSPIGPDSPITLAESETVLQKSREARQVLSALLNEFSSP